MELDVTHEQEHRKNDLIIMERLERIERVLFGKEDIHEMGMMEKLDTVYIAFEKGMTIKDFLGLLIKLIITTGLLVGAVTATSAFINSHK